MKTFSILFSIIFCINLNAQKGKLYLSSWYENRNPEMNIPSDKYSYFKKSNLYYYITNDNHNIYIDMKIEDAGVQNRILKQGLIVWINMDSRVAKSTGIRYPIGSQYSTGRNMPNLPDNVTNTDGSPVSPLNLAKTIELIGFTNEEARRIPSDNADNFRGSVNFDNEGTLYYRMIMPVEKLPFRNSRDGIGAMPFALGIEYGLLPPMGNQRGTMESRPPSGPPSGGARGGSPGGSRPGGGASGGRAPGGAIPGAASISSQNTTPPVIMWIKNIKLAPEK